MSLSCLKHVKRGENNTRPDAPPHHVFLCGIVDCSGSMYELESTSYENLSELINQQSELYKEKKIDTDVRITVFNSEQRTIIGNNKVYGKSIKDIKRLNPEDFKCSGMTKLYDTVVDNLNITFKARKSYIKSLPKSVRMLNPKIPIIFIVLTDGLDLSLIHI